MGINIDPSSQIEQLLRDVAVPSSIYLDGLSILSFSIPQLNRVRRKQPNSTEHPKFLLKEVKGSASEILFLPSAVIETM